MTKKQLTPTRLLAAASLACAAATANAQGGTVQLPAQNTYTGTTSVVSGKTKSSYKKATWTTYQSSLKGGSTSREIPPTDCPPLPPKDCLDTWDDELTTASPSR